MTEFVVTNAISVAIDAILNLVVGPMIGKIAAILIPADLIAAMRNGGLSAFRLGLGGNTRGIKYNISGNGGLEYLLGIGNGNGVFYLYAGLSFLAQGHNSVLAYGGAVFRAKDSSEYEGMRLRMFIGIWDRLPTNLQDGIRSLILNCAAAATDTLGPGAAAFFGEFFGLGPGAVFAEEAMNYLRWLVQVPKEITGIGLQSFLSNLSFEVDFRLGGDPTRGFGFNVDFNWTQRKVGTGGTAATGLAVVWYEQLWPGRRVQF